MFVTLDYQTMLEDFDKNKKMELLAILKLLENAGNKHSDIANANIMDSTTNGRAWVLTDWYLELDEYPSYDDKIQFVTWAETLNSIFTICRDFNVIVNDKIIGKATSRWAILDTKTLRPVKVEQSVMDKHEPEDKKAFEYVKLPKIELPETFQIEKDIHIRRSDIDYNNHVHNLVYLDYALDTLPQELYENRNFKHLHITYRLAVMPDEQIICKFSKINDKCIFAIFSKDGVLKTQIELY